MGNNLKAKLAPIEILKIKKLLKRHTISDTARILNMPYGTLYKHVTRYNMKVHHSDPRGRYVNPKHSEELTKDKLKKMLETRTVASIAEYTGYSRYWIYLLMDKYGLTVKIKRKTGPSDISRYSDKLDNYPFKSSELRELLKRKTTKEIATEYKLDYPDLQKYMHYHNLKVNIHAGSKFRKKEIQRLLNNNTITDTAKILETGPETIYRYIKKYNLKTPYRYTKSGGKKRNHKLWKRRIAAFHEMGVTLTLYAKRYRISVKRLIELFDTFGYYHPKKSPKYCTSDIGELLNEYTVNEIEKITGIPRQTINSYIAKYDLPNGTGNRT